MDFINAAFLPFAVAAAFQAALRGRSWIGWAALGVFLGPLAIFLVLVAGDHPRPGRKSGEI